MAELWLERDYGSDAKDHGRMWRHSMPTSDSLPVCAVPYTLDDPIVSNGSNVVGVESRNPAPWRRTDLVLEIALIFAENG